MRFLKYALPGLIVVSGLLVSSTASFAKPEYAKTEKKTCVFCHVKAGSKDLNEAGKYYKEHNHSLAGYQK